MAEPERNVEQPRDGDHLSVMGETDWEERHADGADQARDIEESSEEAQPVLRRYRQLQGTKDHRTDTETRSLSDVESDNDI